jgi:NADPH:quinone reductase-like Zn-dependent oxidoreductase
VLINTCAPLSGFYNKRLDKGAGVFKIAMWIYACLGSYPIFASYIIISITHLKMLMIMKTMYAVVYNKKAQEKLQYIETEIPVPGDEEVLIKVHAASINAADYRSMKMGIIPKKKIFGADVAGIVTQVGRNVTRFKVGDQVAGDLSINFGGFAHYATAHQKKIVIKPASISFTEAAAFPMASSTALMALRDKGKIQEGHDVLIIGSSGGVGTFAVQWARYFGAQVTAVCSTRNIEQSRALGAHQVIDYTKEDFTKSPKRYDVIVVANGNYSLSACKKLLKPGGTYVCAGGALSQILKTIFLGFFMSMGSRKIEFLAAKCKPEDLEWMLGLMVSGQIKPVIEKIYPLQQTAQAFEYISKGHARGKILIQVN